MGGKEKYPDPSDFDENLYSSIQKLPNNEVMDLKFLQKNIWSEVVTFDIPREKIIRGMQANMFTVTCVNKDNISRNVIVKRIVPTELPEKPSLDIWRGFITSVRTEIDFYKELLERENEPIRKLFPRIYTSLGTPPELDNSPMKTSFSIMMQDLGSDYIQKPGMTEREARSVMESLARLHAHYWAKLPETSPRGSFWVLEKRRDFSELENADTTWNEFVNRFPDLESLHPDVRKIGSVLSSKAEALDVTTAQGANTLIHGDAWGANFFFAKDESPVHKSQPFLFIDMQWAGRGHPLQDVALALTTTLDESNLDKMDDLVDFYIDRLDERLKERCVSDFNKVKLRSEYDLVWLDYARVIVTRKWKKLSPESMGRKTKSGPFMNLRSWPHVRFITKRLCRLLL